jgi:raffinose/stachyose/melibiose transport system substrate-binding protein
MKPFVDAGALLPLNDYLTADDKAKILPGSLDNMTFDGKIYGLGYSMSVGTFFVNTALFDQYKVKIPTNWDELLAAVKAFRAAGITPMTVGGKEPWTIAMYNDIIAVRQAGAKACIAALGKTGDWTNPDIIEGFNKLQQLVDAGAFEDGAAGVSRDESEVPFYEGKVPMYINGSWTIGNVNKSAAIAGKVKIVPFPALGPNSNLNDWTGGAAEIFVANAKGKHIPESVTTLKYICEHMAAENYLAGVGLPTWKVNVDTSKIDPLTLSLVDLTKNASSFVLWFNTYLGGQDSTLYEQTTQALFMKTITPQQAAEALQAIKTTK